MEDELENEAFNKYIEFDDSESEWEKENEGSTRPVVKTKKEQINKIIAFTNDYSEKLVGKGLYTVLWNDLTTELNNIGPPTHLNTEWKRIWSVFKHNKKKRSGKIGSSRSSRDQPPQQVKQYLDQPPQQVKQISPSPATDRDCCSEMLKKISVVLDNQTVIIEKMDEVKNILKDIKQKLVQ